MTDSGALIQKILDGDTEAFRELITANQRLVFHVVFRLVENPADREDLCQDIFVKVYQNLQRFKHNCKLSTWIATIAYNTAINSL
ncbi:MAG: RNA polymerase subunit sigma-24, partial [Phototrophicales bacterium]